MADGTHIAWTDAMWQAAPSERVGLDCFAFGSQ